MFELNSSLAAVVPLLTSKLSQLAYMNSQDPRHNKPFYSIHKTEENKWQHLFLAYPSHVFRYHVSIELHKIPQNQSTKNHNVLTTVHTPLMIGWKSRDCVRWITVDTMSSTCKLPSQDAVVALP